MFGDRLRHLRAEDDLLLHLLLFPAIGRSRGFARRGRDRLADRGWTPGHTRNGRNGRKNSGVI